MKNSVRDHSSLAILTFAATMFLIAKLIVVADAQSVTTWTTYSLTGTGLSVESPVPFKLDQDKPDPFLEGQTAFVRWSVSNGGVFSTISYEKNTRNIQTPRQKLDRTATLFAEMNKPTLSRVTDTTFMGEPAALFEENYYNTYDKVDTSRRMLVFGRGGELTTINITYQVPNKESKAIADRMYASVKRSGATAASSSPLPPINWKRLNFKGLFVETPTETPFPECETQFTKSALYERTTACYQWGNNLTLKMANYVYFFGLAPTPRSQAENSLSWRRTADAAAKLTPVSEVSITDLNIAGGDGVLLRMYVGYGTVGTIEEYYFIRRQEKIWEVRVERSVRWETTEEIAKRIKSSFSLTAPTQQAASKTYDQYFLAGKAYAQNGEHEKAVAEFNEAAKLQGGRGELFFYRAISLEKLGRIQDAIDDYGKLVTLKYSLAVTYYNRGTMFLRLPNYPAAIQDFTASIALDASKSSRFYNRGQAYYRSEDFNKAYADFDAAARVDPKDPDNFIMMGRSACKLGLIMTALHAQEKAIALGAKVTKGCSN